MAAKELMLDYSRKTSQYEKESIFWGDGHWLFWEECGTGVLMEKKGKGMDERLVIVFEPSP